MAGTKTVILVASQLTQSLHGSLEQSVVKLVEGIRRNKWT